MKKVLLIIYLLTFFFSCKKEKNELNPTCQNNNSVINDSVIYAGDYSGNGVIYTDVIPDDTVIGPYMQKKLISTKMGWMILQLKLIAPSARQILFLET